jgi:hypothetical protein
LRPNDIVPKQKRCLVLIVRAAPQLDVAHRRTAAVCVRHDMVKLERGRFAHLWRGMGDAPIVLTVSELDPFLEGDTIAGRMTLSPPPLAHVSLASDRAR